MNVRKSIAGAFVLVACLFYCVPPVVAQADGAAMTGGAWDSDAAPETFQDILAQAAERGATQTVVTLVKERRFEVEEVVRQLLTQSMLAALRGEADVADQKRAAAASVADAFARVFGETSLQRAVGFAAGWSPGDMARKLRADSLYEKGTAMRGSRETRDLSHRLYSEALADYRAVGDQLGEGAVLGGLGVVWWYAGDRDSTRLYFEQALEARHLADAQQLVGNSFNDLGSVSRLFFDDYTTSLDYYLKAESLRQNIGDAVGLGRTLSYIAHVYEVLGDRHTAVAYYERSAQVNSDIGDAAAAASAWIGAGVILKDLGRYSDALERLKTAFAVSEADGNVDRMIDALNWIGVVYRWLGDYESALSNYNEVIRLSEESGDETAIGQAFTNIGVVYISADRPERAADYFARALERFDAIGDAPGALAATLNLGSSLVEQGAFAEAEPHLHEALEESRAQRDRVVEARTLILLGNLLNRTDRLDAAVQRHEEGLAIGRELQIPDLIWGAHMGLGDDYDRLGDNSASIQHYESGFATLEGMRASLQTEEEKANFLAQQRYAFEEVITTMGGWHASDPAAGYDQLAFKYAEQAKARAFLDLLAEALSNVRAGIAPELLERQADLLAERSRVQKELLAHPGEADQAARTELLASAASIDEGYRTLQREMYRQNPRYSALQYPTAVTLDEIQTSLLSEEDVLLEYAMGDTSTTLWVVTQDARKLHRLPGRVEIESQVELLRHALSNPEQGNPARFAATAHRLYELLLQPAEDMLTDGRRLIIVPDGTLFYLPFEVLVTVASEDATTYAELPYLIRRHAVAYGQSAGVLKQLRDERRSETPSFQKQLLAFGDPVFGAEDDDGSVFERLPFSGVEVESIARLFAPADADVFVRGDATEAHMKEAGSYRYVHFATHGTIDERRPDFSSVVLASSDEEDGMLQAAEIFNLKMDADLVVLSACQTGLGKMVRGEGLIGLTRAFMYAGAPSLVVSLWRVEDMSTALLMERFYDELIAQERGKAESLQQAKLAMLEEENLAHPFSWAPFVLVGDWE